jgi:hypothetical protein
MRDRGNDTARFAVVSGVPVVDRKLREWCTAHKVLQRKHSAARSRAGGNKALVTPEPMVKLDVASSNVRGGFFPNIGSTGSDAGRYQGAIAEKAVPFPNAARRSQLSSHVAVRTRSPQMIDCVGCFVSMTSSGLTRKIRAVRRRLVNPALLRWRCPRIRCPLHFVQ